MAQNHAQVSKSATHNQAYLTKIPFLLRFTIVYPNATNHLMGNHKFQFVYPNSRYEFKPKKDFCIREFSHWHGQWRPQNLFVSNAVHSGFHVSNSTLKHGNQHPKCNQFLMFLNLDLSKSMYPKNKIMFPVKLPTHGNQYVL